MGQGQRRGSLLGRGTQSVLVRLRVWGEPQGGWAVSLSREKERKTTLSIELKIELRAGQAVAWKGGMLLPGAQPALAGLGPDWRGVGEGVYWRREACRAQGCHQLT